MLFSGRGLLITALCVCVSHSFFPSYFHFYLAHITTTFSRTRNAFPRWSYLSAFDQINCCIMSSYCIFPSYNRVIQAWCVMSFGDWVIEKKRPVLRSSWHPKGFGRSGMSRALEYDIKPQNPHGTGHLFKKYFCQQPRFYNRSCESSFKRTERGLHLNLSFSEAFSGTRIKRLKRDWGFHLDRYILSRMGDLPVNVWHFVNMIWESLAWQRLTENPLSVAGFFKRNVSLFLNEVTETPSYMLYLLFFHLCSEKNIFLYFRWARFSFGKLHLYYVSRSHLSLNQHWGWAPFW